MWAGWGERPSPHHPGLPSSKQRPSLVIEHRPCVISLHTLRAKVKGHIAPRCLLVCVQSGPPPLWSWRNKALWWGTSLGSWWGIRDPDYIEEDTQMSHSQQWFIRTAGKRSVWADDPSLFVKDSESHIECISFMALARPTSDLSSYVSCSRPCTSSLFNSCRFSATWKQLVVDGLSSSTETTAVWTSRERGRSTRWWDRRNALTITYTVIHIH